MIDIRKALSQRCYIIFDSNEQLVKFVKEHDLPIVLGVWGHDITLSVKPNMRCETHPYKPNDGTPTYHHSQLKITDDGE